MIKKFYRIFSKIIFDIALVTFGVCLILSLLVIACYFNIELLFMIGFLSFTLMVAITTLNDIIFKKSN